MNYFKIIMVIARSEGGNDYCFQQIHQQFLLLDQEKISKESQQKKKKWMRRTASSLLNSYTSTILNKLAVDTYSKAKLAVCEAGKRKNLLKDYIQSSSSASPRVDNECHWAATRKNGRLVIVLQALAMLLPWELEDDILPWLLPFHVHRTNRMVDFFLLFLIESKNSCSCLEWL